MGRSMPERLPALPGSVRCSGNTDGRNSACSVACGPGFTDKAPRDAWGCADWTEICVLADAGAHRAWSQRLADTSTAHRSNKATGITSDVPSEAQLTPKFWGMFVCE
mgnify:CR=1 FL=1